MIARRDALFGAVPQHRFVNSDRLRFHYLEWDNNGPPIMLAHGTGFHAYVWKPIAQLLSQSFRVLALDQRGHGDSSKPEGGYGWNDFGDDLHRFLGALGLAHVTTVGHSAGATAIAYCSARHPGSVARAVLIAVRGSSSRIQLMGQPRNCHQAAPRVAAMQNHRNSARKKTWLIRRTVTMRMRYGP